MTHSRSSLSRWTRAGRSAIGKWMTVAISCSFLGVQCGFIEIYWVLSQFFWGYLLVIKRECPPYLQPFGCHSPHKCFLGNSKCHVSMAGIRRVSHAPQSFGVGTRVILFSCWIRKVERMVAVKTVKTWDLGDMETGKLLPSTYQTPPFFPMMWFHSQTMVSGGMFFTDGSSHQPAARKKIFKALKRTGGSARWMVFQSENWTVLSTLLPYLLPYNKYIYIIHINIYSYNIYIYVFLLILLNGVFHTQTRLYR